MGFIFAWGLFSQKRSKREKRENYPHAKITTFTVFNILLSEYQVCSVISYGVMINVFILIFKKNKQNENNNLSSLRS